MYSCYDLFMILTEVCMILFMHLSVTVASLLLWLVDSVQILKTILFLKVPPTNNFLLGFLLFFLPLTLPFFFTFFGNFNICNRSEKKKYFCFILRISFVLTSWNIPFQFSFKKLTLKVFHGPPNPPVSGLWYMPSLFLRGSFFPCICQYIWVFLYSKQQHPDFPQWQLFQLLILHRWVF